MYIFPTQKREISIHRKISHPINFHTHTKTNIHTNTEKILSQKSQLNPIFYNFQFSGEKNIVKWEKNSRENKNWFSFFEWKIYQMWNGLMAERVTMVVVVIPILFICKIQNSDVCVCYLLLWCLQIRRQMILITKKWTSRLELRLYRVAESAPLLIVVLVSTFHYF